MVETNRLAHALPIPGLPLLSGPLASRKASPAFLASWWSRPRAVALFQGRPERTVGQVNVGQVLPVIDVFGPKPQGLLEAGNGLFGSPGFRLSDFSSAACLFS